MYETLCRQYVYFAVMYLHNPGLWGPYYGYLSILICLCPCRVAARRWYAGYLCVLFSSLWVGPLSQTWLRDPVGISRATSPLNDITRFFKNAGRHRDCVWMDLIFLDKSERRILAGQSS